MDNISIPANLHGQRIDVALAQLLPQYSRSQLTNWLKQGLIHCNNTLLKPKEKVQDGDILSFSFTEAVKDDVIEDYPAEAINLDIVYEDDSVLILNKPAGMVVHPGAGNREHTMVNALLHHYPPSRNLPRAGIVHRLDKDTTGLLVVAKTLTAQTHLVRQMQAREIQRHYITLVQGHLISGDEITTSYGRHPRNRLKMAVHDNGSRIAITHYSLKKQYQYFTLLEVRLMTGRTHQIRVHMAHINHAVVGDPLYGGRMRLPPAAEPELIQSIQQFKRQALHAAHLAFTHPETLEFMTFNAELPADFKHLLNVMDQHLL